ncbi:MAG: hypothetical protein CM15mP120_29050 [Pseudomonadota bacterium]|nr:MAG: hypothetical protein CM15mP120_29050 [Pseudomonadota bacterium]
MGSTQLSRQRRQQSEPFVCWGQDRVWRVEQEIAQRVG